MGATGLLGTALCRSLRESGIAVTAYSRGHISGDLERAHWDPDHGEIDTAPLAQSDAVVNLAGESLVGGRWTKARKERLVRSRVHSTQLLVRTLGSLPNRPHILINGSAVGFYGDCGEDSVTESKPRGEGFLADLCAQWEAAAMEAAEHGIRVVLLRTSMVLSREGGALASLLPLFRAGLGGQLGPGRQYFPWITLHDAVRVIRFAIETPSLVGPLNVVAPEATRNSEFTATLASVLHRPAFMRVPKFALRVTMGEVADELLLSGACVNPAKLEQTGFRFDYPRLVDALSSVID